MLAVTGSTGRLGAKVAARLAKLGVEQRLIVRDPGRAPKLPGAGVAQACITAVNARFTAISNGAFLSVRCSERGM